MLPIKLFGDADLHIQAVQLASRYGLLATYDAHYLALADHLEAELWTAVESELLWVRLWA